MYIILFRLYFIPSLSFVFRDLREILAIFPDYLFASFLEDREDEFEIPSCRQDA